MSYTPHEEKLLREKFAETEKNFSRLAYRQIIWQVADEIFTSPRPSPHCSPTRNAEREKNAAVV
jgi:hypothetical protein